MVNNKLLFILLFFFTFTFAKDIDINFKNLEISELIRISSKILDKNILLTDEIKGKVNFISNKKINEKELKNILLIILESKGYTLLEKNNILRVKKLKKILVKAKPFKKYLKVNTKILLVKKLKHVEARDILNIIKNIIKQDKNKKNILVSLDESTNSLILIAKQSEINFYEKLINKLDVQKIQVYVKVKIIEVNDDELNNIGIKYGILAGSSKNGNLLTFSSSFNSKSAFAFNINDIGLSIPNISSGIALGASLNLLKQNYALNIVSEPSLLCLNNNESNIYVGETISILRGTTTNSSGTTNSYTREEVGLKLMVKPRVIDNKVILHIKAILEGVKTTRTSSGNADTSKKQIQTIAIVNNGESVILGGLIEQRKETSKDSIPFFSSIPFLGKAFENNIKNTSFKNLMIIITPYIIPKFKDLTYIREQLASLKNLEDQFLQKNLKKLKDKKEKDKKIIDSPTISKKHLEMIYGVN